MAGAIGRMKAMLGLRSRRERYHHGDYRSLEDISDPHEWEDETRTSWREYIAENKGFVLTAGVLGVIALVVVLHILATYMPAVLGSTRVQLTTGALALFITGYVLGGKNQRERFLDYDWLVLVTSNGVTVYLGTYREANDGDYGLFTPVAGFSPFGHKSYTYSIGQVSLELAQLASAANWDPDDPAIIRVDPDIPVSKTDYGTIIGALADGLALDEYKKESNLKLEVPDKADEDMLDVLQRRIMELEDELRNARDNAEQYRIQRNTARRDAKKARNEHVTEFTEGVDRMSGAFRADRSLSDDDSSEESGVTPQKQAVEQELAPQND